MLAVTVRVTNIGTAPGVASCTIQASSSTSRATGVDVAGVRGTLAPHHATTFVDDLTITSLGARRIDHVTVRCG